VYLVGTLWLLGTVVVRGSVEVLAALALMAAGVPAFLYLRSRRAAEARPSPEGPGRASRRGDTP